MPRIFVRREAEVIEAEQHHARSPGRPVERRLPCQREIRHPFIQPRAKIRPPQELRRVLPIQRGDAALRLQHFASATVHFPAHIKRQLWFYAHDSSATASPSDLVRLSVCAIRWTQPDSQGYTFLVLSC